MPLVNSIAAAEKAVFSALSDLAEDIIITEESKVWDSSEDKYVVTGSSSRTIRAIVFRIKQEDDPKRSSLIVYIPHSVPVSDASDIRITIGGVDYWVETGNWSTKLPTEPLKLVLKSGG